MKYLKFTQYIYLAFAGFFIYDGITKMSTDESPWLSFVIAVVAIFMFFFRRSFYTKFENRRNNNS